MGRVWWQAFLSFILGTKLSYCHLQAVWYSGQATYLIPWSSAQFLQRRHMGHKEFARACPWSLGEQKPARACNGAQTRSPTPNPLNPPPYRAAFQNRGPRAGSQVAAQGGFDPPWESEKSVLKTWILLKGNTFCAKVLGFSFMRLLLSFILFFFLQSILFLFPTCFIMTFFRHPEMLRDEQWIPVLPPLPHTHIGVSHLTLPYLF